MTVTESSNKRIAKNTIFLFLRMLLIMAVTLYTSRVVLDVLGVSDYGIYSVIGGIVVLVSMINHSMSAATQRFITFELGQNDLNKVSKTFCMSMTAHLLICAIVLALGETIGLYYVNNYLNIAAERHNAAFWVYQISLLTVVVNIIRIPYIASVIAYEKMSFFAIASIIETILKLFVVCLLVISGFDKLIFYTFLVLISTIAGNLIYWGYCKRRFSTCGYYWYMDKSYFKKLMGFFGWNFVGAVATTGTHQVGNVIVNFFCGTVANAAYGVASQVNGAINGLTSNFQTAFTPQIVKLYSQQKMPDLYTLMNRSALMSYYLLFMVAMPIFLKIDLVLSIWLKEVPKYAEIFCQWLIVYAFIDSLQAPLWKAITATGHIKYYEIWLNLVLMFNIPLSYFCLKWGFPPYYVVAISALLNLVTAVLRTIHVKVQIKFPIGLYLKDVILRSLFVTIVFLAFNMVINIGFVVDSLFAFVLYFMLSVFVSIFLIVIIGFNNKDRALVISTLKSKLKPNK